MLFDSIFISEKSAKSGDQYEVILSNINFLNTLFESSVKYTEMSENALHSYYVDFYVTQMNNGGFSKFVLHSRWNSILIEKIRSGMQLMQALKNLALFNKGAAIIEKMGPEKMDKFFSGEDTRENEEKSTLDAFDGEFFSLQETEDLIELNSEWIVNHESLKVLSEEDIKGQIVRIIELSSNKSKGL